MHGELVKTMHGILYIYKYFVLFYTHWINGKAFGFRYFS